MKCWYWLIHMNSGVCNDVTLNCVVTKWQNRLLYAFSSHLLISQFIHLKRTPRHNFHNPILIQNRYKNSTYNKHTHKDKNPDPSMWRLNIVKPSPIFFKNNSLSIKSSTLWQSHQNRCPNEQKCPPGRRACRDSPHKGPTRVRKGPPIAPEWDRKVAPF